MNTSVSNNEDILMREVRKVFADVTRYPEDILDQNADLESDLGIDSVKLGEIFSVLRERYNLPEVIDVPPEQFRTLGSISSIIYDYTTHPEKTEIDIPVGDVTVGDVNVGGVTVGDVTNAVIKTFAEVTRYPVEILDPDVDLESDLGIDSVKLGEIFSVLREQYSLPEQMDIPPENLRTISGISKALQNYISMDRDNNDAVAAPLKQQEPQARETKPNLIKRTQTETKSNLPLAGKVALVTGSGRGIGRDIAMHLAEQGAQIIVNTFHSREAGDNVAAEIRENGGLATHIWSSAANPEHVDKMFEGINSEFGGLDYLVANASNGMLASLKDITPEDWEKAFRTNVVGLHRCAMRAAELMRKRGGGKIITMSSPACHGYVEYFGCMGAVKAAVESLTRSLAIELEADNIQVNCISPGPTYGDLLNKWPDSERLIAQWETKTVYNRLCETSDVSNLVSYLLSESVKMFNGSVLVMDGGISIRGF